jgi:hypothetical protein
VSGFDILWNDCIQEETHLESMYGLKSSQDSKFSLSIQTRKDKFRNIVSGEFIAQYGKKKNT